MRWLVIAALAACSSFGAYASEPLADEATAPVSAAALSAEAAVVVTPVPMPASVIEVLNLSNPAPKLRSARKLNLAKKKPFPNILLTRTERHQLALLTEKPKPGELLRREYQHKENGESGYGELVLHRFFSRPRLATEPENEANDDPELSETVRLRLFLARMKAVEAHAMTQVSDTGDVLSDAIKQRLQEARLKAVEAHQKKFG